jgi:hypothetical protein
MYAKSNHQMPIACAHVYQTFSSDAAHNIANRNIAFLAKIYTFGTRGGLILDSIQQLTLKTCSHRHWAGLTVAPMMLENQIYTDARGSNFNDVRGNQTNNWTNITYIVPAGAKQPFISASLQIWAIIAIAN